MKTRILLTVTIAAFLVACGGGSQSSKSESSNRPFDGTFTTEYGMKFQLNPDSTTLLTFDDTITYEGKWTIRHKADIEYANIELAGNINHYYFKNGKLYRNEQQMMEDVNGMKVSYLN